MLATFISGSKGDIFILYLPPVADAPDRGDLIFVPPFAEEMNRSRHTIGVHARALQAAGIGVLLVDLYGTGDSEGSFADARWEVWRSDIIAARDWLNDRGRNRVGLWGLRLGGLLAADTLFDAQDSFTRLLLVEPIVSGKQFMDQFLRIGVAEGIESGGRSLTLNEMRLKLSRTEPIEVAGYIVSRVLAHSIDRSDLIQLARSLKVPLTWIDASPPSPERRDDIEMTAESCAAAGVLFDHQLHRTPPFWTLQEADIDSDFMAMMLAAAGGRP